MSQIVLDDIWKVFGDGTEAVRSFDLEIGDGEFVVLVGPSGCGKTTLLRMVAGLEAISKGEVRIGDRVEKGRIPFLARRGVRVGESRFWAGLVGRVMRRPWLSILLAAPMLGALVLLFTPQGNRRAIRWIALASALPTVASALPQT